MACWKKRLKFERSGNLGAFRGVLRKAEGRLGEKDANDAQGTKTQSTLVLEGTSPDEFSASKRSLLFLSLQSSACLRLFFASVPILQSAGCTLPECRSQGTGADPRREGESTNQPAEQVARQASRSLSQLMTNSSTWLSVPPASTLFQKQTRWSATPRPPL